MRGDTRGLTGWIASYLLPIGPYDGHRKRLLAEHPHLTLTGLYNVRERRRAGAGPDALDAKEEQYVFPTIGTHRVDHVETSHVLKVLGPIWLTKAETVRRVLQRIRTVLDWATASGFRSGENPVDSVAKGLPRQVCEMALAHALKDRVKGGYRRGDLFEKRRELMSTWADFATGALGKMVSLRSA